MESSGIYIATAEEFFAWCNVRRAEGIQPIWTLGARFVNAENRQGQSVAWTDDPRAVHVFMYRFTSVVNDRVDAWLEGK